MELLPTASPGSVRLARESHPTPEARSAREYPSDGSVHGQSIAVACKQCGFQIKDLRTQKTCPVCTTDNIEGVQLSY